LPISSLHHQAGTVAAAKLLCKAANFPIAAPRQFVAICAIVTNFLVMIAGGLRLPQAVKLDGRQGSHLAAHHHGAPVLVPKKYIEGYAS
jgi:hypothetical protein